MSAQESRTDETILEFAALATGAASGVVVSDRLARGLPPERRPVARVIGGAAAIGAGLAARELPPVLVVFILAAGWGAVLAGGMGLTQTQQVDGRVETRAERARRRLTPTR